MDTIGTKRPVEGEAEAPAIDINAGRRAFLKHSGLAAAFAATLGGAAGVPGIARADHQDDTDVQILNFALNLEYLEAEFYLRAAFGRNLNVEDATTGAGTGGTVNGGRKVPFQTPLIQQIAQEIAIDEENHVQFLRAALGNAKVKRPAMDFTNAFNAAAKAAGIGDTFDAFANETNFLLAAFIFEDVGVTAYKGAARYLDNPDFLEAAAGILAVEAYHAGAIRTLLLSQPNQGTVRKIASQISRLRDGVDGESDLDQGIALNNMANIVPADQNGIAFSRSPRQVLNIVYLGVDATKGGFFPNGVNAGPS